MNLDEPGSLGKRDWCVGRWRVASVHGEVVREGHKVVNTWLVLLGTSSPPSHGAALWPCGPVALWSGHSEAYSLFTLLDLARFPVSEVSPVLFQAFSRTRTSSLSLRIPACLIRKHPHLLTGPPISSDRPKA